jgi:RNA polymerase sigma-70 factor (ECF subfamily)
MQPSEFEAFYCAHSRRLLAFITRRTFDVEVARDLTAERFAEAFEHRRRFRGSSDAEAAAWLFGIARHQLGRYARTGRVRRKAVERLGTDLSGRERDALRMRVIDQRSYPEIAETLGVSEQAARARVSRALPRLADALEMAAAPTEVTP